MIVRFLLPDAPVFQDLARSYLHLIGDHEIMYTTHTGDAEGLIPSSYASNVFVCYHRPRLDILKQPRAGKVLFVYCEPLTMSGMTHDGLAYLRSFEDVWPYLDGALVHTPQMKEDLVKHLREVEKDRLANYGDIAARIGVFPAGLDPNLFLPPPPTVVRDIDFFFYGSIAGKRSWSVPALKGALGDRLVVAPHGTYGDALTELLHRSKVSVYVAHSDVRSFSTWRMWRDSLAGAAMAIECLDGAHADAWPLASCLDYWPLPRLTPETLGVFVDQLKFFVDGGFYADDREHARAEAEFRTTQHCVEKWLLPFVKTLGGIT